jgi:hypothetical protein
MSEDYKAVDLEVKAFQQGYHSGVVDGQIQGLGYLINMLIKMHDELVIERNKANGNVDNDGSD